ncbi:G1/S-specific cyclin-E1 [Anthonomus grandis grandis]|uniref:G1/S-specific cyclin-E1 n=1 Tax=Anthonomus grandis grandis TaxID=2921223 RepID=UPI0021654B6C|nr:G1/S-specific cyclin-E1 [Anthonomus grandis grandis]XP_050302536.1 G1/S-specific cyclin-E1 [Anthonomus grandis grandis]XP_050302537.1 G1/S-specific cyclin-E1 [Anthonomus grandis grandis]XP_050302538.1 G1/S-specific cyclin-E1 [Anthonomus grandis grandis]
MSHLKTVEVIEQETLDSPDAENTDLLNRLEEENYSEANKLPFQELLRMHTKQTVWGFKYGQNIRESALARDKCLLESSEKKRDTESGCKSDAAPGSCTKSEPGPSSSQVCTTEKDHKTPHSRKEGRSARSRTSKRKNSSKQDFGSPRKTRCVPLPLMNWADSKEVWMYMVYKEEASLNLRNPRLFENFTNFMPRMRAILLDWVMEVCEVYHLRRVTYYLTVDYFDRFLSLRPDVPKSQLQLVGVTCLFLASKLEEVYPPRLSEFSYVCDGACSPDDILNCELLILNSLGWDLNVMTPSDWLNLYMQIHFQAPSVVRRRLHQDTTRNFLFPQYSGYQFTRASQLLDAFSLDPGFLKFSYSTLAAAAMYFMYGKQVAADVSGLTWDQLQPCAEYMAAFYLVLRDTPDPRLISCKSDTPQDDKGFPNLESKRHRIPQLVKDENHSLQTHVVNMEYFEKSAIIRLEQMGLKVERTYVSKNKKSSAQSPGSPKTPDDTKENSRPEVEENEDLVCMYDVEKVGCDAVALDDSDISISNVSSPDADLILADDKALMSFDEILEGIVKCNQKNFPGHTLISPTKDETLQRLD